QDLQFHGRSLPCPAQARTFRLSSEAVMRFLAASVLFVVAVAAQSPPRFEVASIKLSPRPPVGPIGIRIGPSQARFTFASLKNYVGWAYGVRDHEIAAPGWLATAMFDVVAKMPDGAAAAQVPAMLRTLLEERFHIRTHREPRELAVYALELNPRGPRLVR